MEHLTYVALRGTTDELLAGKYAHVDTANWHNEFVLLLHECLAMFNTDPLLFNSKAQQRMNNIETDIQNIQKLNGYASANVLALRTERRLQLVIIFEAINSLT